VEGKRITVFVAAVLLALAAASCSRKEPGSPFRAVVDRPVQLEVDNNNFLDVNVYVVASGSSVRLGSVGGKRMREFTLDPRRVSMTGGLQFLVDPIGGTQTYLSPTVYPFRGATVELNVGAFIEKSFVSMR
jgi:hypothetical protein